MTRKLILKSCVILCVFTLICYQFNVCLLNKLIRAKKKREKNLTDSKLLNGMPDASTNINKSNPWQYYYLVNEILHDITEAKMVKFYISIYLCFDLTTALLRRQNKVLKRGIDLEQGDSVFSYSWIAPSGVYSNWNLSIRVFNKCSAHIVIMTMTSPVHLSYNILIDRHVKTKIAPRLV